MADVESKVLSALLAARNAFTRAYETANLARIQGQQGVPPSDEEFVRAMFIQIKELQGRLWSAIQMMPAARGAANPWEIIEAYVAATGFLTEGVRCVDAAYTALPDYRQAVSHTAECMALFERALVTMEQGLEAAQTPHRADS